MALFKSRTCSLCGGKLDGNRRCLECGLDNSKNDDMYKKMLKQSQCENKPLTHVHNEKSMHSYENTSTAKHNATQNQTRQSSTYQSESYYRTEEQRRSGKKKSGCFKTILTFIIVMCGVIPTIVSLMNGAIINLGNKFFQEEYHYSQYLDGGFYTVGVHIAEGEYDIELISGEFASIDILRYDGYEIMFDGFYFLETPSSDNWAKDVYLEEGDVVVIEEGIEVALRSSDENITLYDDNIMENPLELDEEMILLQGTMVAGEDFPAGVYDIYYSASYDENEFDEYGNVDIAFWDVDVDMATLEESFWFYTSMGDMTYKNVPLATDSQITVMDLQEVYLIPSEFVDANTTYLYE